MLPGAVGALVWLVPGVDLPVAVEAAGVRQLLPAHLARHARLPVRPDLTGSAIKKRYRY